MKRDKVMNLFDFLPKSKIKAGAGLEEGIYPFYTSSESQSKYLDEYLYEPGCLVFGTGGKASVHFATRRFATSTDCITIKPKPATNLDTGYVFQYLKGNMQVLEGGFKGAGLKHISKAYLLNIQIPHPEDLAEQKRIAHLLSKVEGLIAQRKKHLQQLDDLLKSTFLEIFGDPVRNEMGWELSPIDGLCVDIIDCPHSTPTYSDEKTNYFCVRSSDITNGYLDLNETYQVDESVFHERIKRYKPQVGDIVYSREGGRLGNAARIIGQENVCLGQRMMLFKVNAENRSEFLWALLESASFKFKLQGLVGGGAAPRVNIKDLKKIVVIKPPIGRQEEFATVVVKIDQIKSRYQQSLTRLKNLYGALSQKAFKGELDVSRVIVPTAKGEPTEEQQTVPSIVVEFPPTIELPAPGDLRSLASVEGRKAVIEQWLNSYLGQLGSSDFSAVFFMEAAQQRLSELLEDEAPEQPELGLAEYDQLKTWVFQALENGQLTQSYDDAGNRVQVKSAMV